MEHLYFEIPTWPSQCLIWGCGFNRSSQHFSILLNWSEQMKRRIYYSTEQRREIWDRWKRGESAHEIGRLFDRPHSSIFKILMKTGGLRPSGGL